MARRGKGQGENDIKTLAKKMYEAAKQQLAEIEEKRMILLGQIKFSEQLLGLSNKKQDLNEEEAIPELEMIAKEKSPRKAKSSSSTKSVEKRPAKKRTAMIRTDELRRDVLEILGRTENSLTNSELLEHLGRTDREKYEKTASFRARLSSMLKVLISENSISKVDRGVYRLNRER